MWSWLEAVAVRIIGMVSMRVTLAAGPRWVAMRDLRSIPISFNTGFPETDHEEWTDE